MDNSVKTNPLATEKVSKLLRKFAIPSVVAMLVNSLYNIVDQIFIGQGVGYLGNAATNIIFPLVTFALAISVMIANGCSAFMSIKFGQGRNEDAAIGFGSAFISGIAIGIVFLIALIFSFKSLLPLFGATADVMPYAIDYGNIIIFGFPLSIVTIILENATRADGNPRYTMIAMLCATVTNIVLDAIFVLVFHWGVQGAAIATVISTAINLTVSSFYIPRFKNIKVTKHIFKFNFKMWKRVITLGTSSFITQIGGFFTQIAINNALKYYGALSIYGSDIPLSVFGIVMKIYMIIFSIMLGVGFGQQPIAGFNYGSRDFKRVREVYKCTVTTTTIVATVGWAVLMLFPEQVISLFGSESSLYVEFAVKCTRIFLMLIFLAGFQNNTSQFFQAIGRPIISSILTLLRQMLIMIPLALTLPIFYGIDGMLFAGPITDALATLITFFFIRREMKKINLMEKQDKLKQS